MCTFNIFGLFSVSNNTFVFTVNILTFDEMSWCIFPSYDNIIIFHSIIFYPSCQFAS